jgi:hypothetical protein
VEQNTPYLQIKVDDKALREVIAGVEDACRYQMKVGILSNEQHPGEDGEPIGMAELGAVHEFGSMARGIPARSFIRKTMFQKRDEFLQKINSNAQHWITVLRDSGMKGTMTQWAIQWQAWVWDCFDGRGFGSWAALSPKTVAARLSRMKKNNSKTKPKKSDTPLIDRGHLRQSIKYEVKQQ